MAEEKLTDAHHALHSLLTENRVPFNLGQGLDELKELAKANGLKLPGGWVKKSLKK